MRVFYKALTLSSLFLLAPVVAGCGSDVKQQLSCNTSQDCLTAAGTLFAPDSSAQFLPQCCGGTCQVESVGCESGFRFLNSQPLVGNCVPESMAMCKLPDMSMPEDLSSSNTD